MPEHLEVAEPPKRIGKPLSDEHHRLAVEKVEQSDFKWWYYRKTVGQARGILNNSLDFKVTAYNFRLIVENHCEWFRKKNHPATTRSVNLSFEEWRDLRAAVNRHRDMLIGRTIGEAVAIVSTSFRCNATNLRGLNKDMQVWVD